MEFHGGVLEKIRSELSICDGYGEQAELREHALNCRPVLGVVFSEEYC